MVVKMEFVSSTIGVNGRFAITTLTFANVLDFRWSDFELGLTLPNPSDTKFRLIEITDSETIRNFLGEGKLREHAFGATKEEDLRHYRISFDDHGTYDIVCTSMSVTVADTTDR